MHPPDVSRLLRSSSEGAALFEALDAVSRVADLLDDHYRTAGQGPDEYLLGYSLTMLDRMARINRV
jgi:hypothetical protein